MLDHLSYGRLEVGVGRGVSPFELKYHKVEHDESREIFIDAFKCISAGLTTDSLSYRGKHYHYENVPIALRPLQQPHPAFWYGSSNTTGSTWAGEHGMHFVSLGPMPLPRPMSTPSSRRSRSAAGRLSPRPSFPGGTAIGVLRHIFVADTDEEAKRFAKPAMELHLAQPQLAARHARGHRPDLAAQCAAWRRLRGLRGRWHGRLPAIPQTVRDEIERQVGELGVNYLLTYLFLGTMSLSDALRSLQLFAI